MTYAKAIMSTEDNGNNSELSKHGCPPVDEIKTDDIRFTPLKSKDDGVLEDQLFDPEQRKAQLRDHTN